MKHYLSGRTIGFRLTTWYAAILAVALIAYAAAMWTAIHDSIHRTVDGGLEKEIGEMASFLQRMPSHSWEEELDEHTSLPGVYFALADDSGIVYRSPAVRDLTSFPFSDAAAVRDATLTRQTGERVSVRLLARVQQIRGKDYRLQVGTETGAYHDALERFRTLLLWSFPGVVALAALVGYAISRRALRPVDGITTAARHIGAGNLSQRLTVPNSGDELQRLSETLNEMIGRLDGAFREITRFTADASHELRTPVAIMRTTAELALRRPRSAGEYREAIEQILHELERTTRLIEDMMLLARADSASVVLRHEPLDLQDPLESACSSGRLLAEGKQVEFGQPARNGVVMAHGDADALRRLFLILLDNAVKYTPSGGRVSVELAKGDDGARITVRDTGIGIAPADLPHIFERFFRSDKARSRQEGGSGLGLAIASWIVQQHHGEIKASSVVGEGSVFTVRLPLVN